MIKENESKDIYTEVGLPEFNAVEKKQIENGEIMKQLVF